ncbi:AsmA family protein [Tateyamaria sp. Alg231-49]|uniref:AsmA family protein n=1 Tax=Tateyamaria sp. Alg231-49 TaxID=1922219 RepID=UPI000D560AFA|nr:AsmA family protein [Tateyamaria sp. Alg231-49]
MPKWVKLSAIWVTGVIGVFLFLGWLALASPFLSQPRGDFAARYLSKELGQDIEIQGGLRIALGSVLRVAVAEVTLPSATMTDVNLVQIDRLEFGLAISDLLDRRINVLEPLVDGLRATLLTDEDGTTSWAANDSSPKAAAAPTNTETRQDPLEFLAERKITATNSSLTYRSAQNGLDLDLVLSTLEISRADTSAPLVVNGDGALNGEALTLTAELPPDQPFQIEAAFDQMSVLINGQPDSAGYANGLSANLSLEIAELGQLLDALKLQKTVAGTGSITAAFEASAGTARIDDLVVDIDLDTGQSFLVEGDIGVLGDPSDVSIDTLIRLYPEDQEPEPTTTRRNLKLISVDMSLAAQPDGVPQRSMVIETNGFVLDTSGVGPPPIAVSGVSRTQDGLVRLGNVVLRIGPPDAPILVVEGAVEDALRLEGADFDADITLPAAALFGAELFQDSDGLGRITGEFRLSGNAQVLGISDLNASSQDTDLWHLDVTGSVRNALNFGDVALNVVADVPSTADLLETLGLARVEAGPLEFDANLISEGTQWDANVRMGVSTSELEIQGSLDAEDSSSIVKGSIESDLIQIDELRDVISAAVELARFDNVGQTPTTEPNSADEVEIQPLVLNQETETNENTDEPPNQLRDVTLLPLGRALLLSGMDLDVGIDLRKIEGAHGTTSLVTDLELTGKKARLGPVKLEYGGGHIEVSAAMDLDETPDRIEFSGSTGGWDFGKIMQAINFKKRASGTLNASFDVSGSPSSTEDFLSSLEGSATLSMHNGSIDTQLLDLAGLGVVPWLFSKSPGPTASIVCVNAPFHISGGSISTKQAVIETDQVQIVVLGNVDVKNQTLDVVGQPRRIGKPLARSPWPFTLSGSLKKPKVKVKDGPRKLRRSDGASTMPDRRKICVPDILQLQ